MEGDSKGIAEVLRPHILINTVTIIPLCYYICSENKESLRLKASLSQVWDASTVSTPPMVTISVNSQKWIWRAFKSEQRYVPPLPRTVFTYLCAKKFSERPVTDCMLGQSHFPFCSQVPCWILKDYMMMKYALQITYRSMQLLILPHALSDSLKSQLIACYLTFHKLRGVSRTVKNKLFFPRGVLGQREKREGKASVSQQSVGIGFSGWKVESNCSQCFCL